MELGRRSETSPASGRRTEDVAALITRIRRLESQAHGIVEMVATERDTLEVLQQFSAMMAAGREAAIAFAKLRLRDSLNKNLHDETAVDVLLEQIEPVLARAARLP